MDARAYFFGNFRDYITGKGVSKGWGPEIELILLRNDDKAMLNCISSPNSQLESIPH